MHDEIIANKLENIFDVVEEVSVEHLGIDIEVLVVFVDLLLNPFWYKFLDVSEIQL